MENDIRALIYGTLISADNPNYTEEQKQESMRRYGLATAGENDWDKIDWEFVLEPFETPDSKNKLADLFGRDIIKESKDKSSCDIND